MADIATQRIPSTPQKKNVTSKTASPQSTKKSAGAQTPAAAKPTESVAESGVHEATQTRSIHETADEEEEDEDEYENVEQSNTGEEEEGEDDETEEAVPAGSVDHEGRVIDDQGHVIGKATSDVPEGSMVDQEGDILDDEGNVIGSAEPEKPFEKADSAISGVKSTAEGLEKPDLEKPDLEKSEAGETPELAAPFGVQDNGEITNASGAVVGKLAEGKPTDLVGTAIHHIDEEGNLKAETGSTLGKAEISPELLEKAASGAGSKLGDAKPEADLPEGEIPEGEEKLGEAGEKLDEAKPDELPEDEEKLGETAEDLKEVDPKSLDKENPIDETKLGEDGKPIEEPQLDESGKPIEMLDEAKEGVEEPKLGEDGKPLEEPQLGEDGEPIEKLDETREGLEEPKLDESGNPIEHELGEDGKPIEKLDEAKEGVEEPQLDESGNPIEEKLDEAKEGVEEPQLDESGQPIEPKLGEDGQPIEEPQLNEAGEPIKEKLGEDGQPILDESGNPIMEKIEEAKYDDQGNLIEEPQLQKRLDDDGKTVLDSQGQPVMDQIDDQGHVLQKKLDDEGQTVLDSQGEPILQAVDSEGNVIPDLSILKGMKVNKAGKIVDKSGTPFGILVDGELKKLIGKQCDDQGQIWNDSGKVIGRAELLPESDREAEASAPFEDFPDSVLDSKGNVIFEGRIVGKLIEGDAKKLEGKKVDPDGDVVDKNGNVLGKAERWQEEDVVEEEPEKEDLSALDGKKVNKAGNVVDDNGKLFGRVNSGVLAKLIGKRCDAEGKIWSETGKVIGTAELLSTDDREEGGDSPFEDFPGAICDKHGNILFEGQIVGKLVSGDAKRLVGKKIDQDGEIVDKIGNVLGVAERWIEEDAPEPEKVDNSALAGKRVNKVGNVVDSHGQIYGRLVQGDPKSLAGRMCDKEGNVRAEDGTIIGRAELVPESEREGQKEGIFSGFDNPKVTKDGKVADSQGVIIGRLIEGDAKKLYGKMVDPDGDVLDKNGNTLGKAERWEEEEKEKAHNPVAGRKVNREGNVVDENGDVIAKLTEGVITKCSGKEIDEDGDVYNQKGQVIGHVTLLEDIPPEPEAEPEPEPEPEPEEPQETEEEKEERLQLAQDKKLAGQMAMCVQQSIDKINPILKMITETIDAAERQPKEELDEQKLVDTVKPLIEQGGQILTEANGVIRGLDPDGRIAANAKHKTAAREATPEEYRLADVLKELAGNVTQTIDNAKKKIAGMPHAKKELNPLWGLLAEPLGQILAAVGLLLAGVLGLVGRLLSGLGLGGLLDNLLGGLGLKGILKGLGLGMVTESLTGRK
jgi:hypothetical protein